MSSSFASQNSQVVKYEKKDEITSEELYKECKELIVVAEQLINEAEELNKRIKKQSELNDIEIEDSFSLNSLNNKLKVSSKLNNSTNKLNEELSRKIETQFDLDDIEIENSFSLNDLKKKLNRKIKTQLDLNDIELGASSELNKLKENPDIKLTEQFIEFSKEENVKLFEVESNCSILTEKLDKEAGLWDELINRVNNKKGAKTESNLIFSKKAKGVIQEIKYCLENIKESIKELDEYHIDMKSEYPQFFDDRLLNNFDESLVAIIQNKRAETQAIRAFTLNRCVQAENLIKLAENMLPLISDRNASNSLTTTAKFLMLTLPSCAVVAIYYWPSIWKKIKQYQEKIKKRKIKGQN